MTTTKNATKVLSAAQKRHFQRLLQSLGLAETKLEDAQKARDLAMANASQFIDFCAEELEVPTGWVFDQTALSFVQVPPGEGGEGGK